MRSWLTNLYRRLASPKFRTAGRRKKSASIAASAIIERLEPRRLLYATAVGSETQANSHTAGDQTHPSVAMDGAGDYVAVWMSDGQDGSGMGIYAQRFNAAGTALGSEFRVNTYTTGDQSFVNGEYIAVNSVAMDTAGDFVITWQSAGEDGSGLGIYAQRYNAAGIAQGSEFRVNTYTTGDQSAPSVAMDSTGNFVITWQSAGQDGSGLGIYAQRYNAAGVAQGTEFQVNTLTNFNQDNPSVGMDAAGDFVITWESDFQNVFSFTVKAQRYNAAGIAQGGEFSVDSLNQIDRIYPSVAMGAAGAFVVTWEGMLGNGIFAQRYNAAGVAQGDIIQVETSNYQGKARAAMGSAGDFVITWEGYTSGPNADEIYARQYNSAGNALGARSQVNTYTTGFQEASSVAMDSAGDFVVAWESQGQDGSGYGIYSQLFKAQFAPVLSQIESAPLNFVGPSASAVTSTLQATGSVTGATITISNNYQNGEDLLGFVNTANITGSWNPATGTLTLAGTDSAINYSAALQSVTFRDVSTVPNTALTRTISFQVANGPLLSNTASRDVTVRETSTSPVITGVNQTITYERNASPQTIAPNIVVTSSTLASATVSFTNWQGEDRIEFYNIYALQHTFTEDLVAHTAILTITGNDTAAHYQTLLQSVVYWDVSNHPITSATRTARFSVFDTLSQGASGTQNIIVSTANTTNLPPVVILNDSSSVAYVAPGPGIAPFNNALVSDPDSNNLTMLTVQITAGYQNDSGGHDMLSFTNQLGIVGTFDAASGTLTLTGSSYVGNYREALRTVTFSSSGSLISTATRTLTVIATDDGLPTPAMSVPVTRNITVAMDVAPLLSQIETTPLNVIGQSPTFVTSTLLAADQDSNNAVGATIKISSNYQSGEDVLGFVSTAKITGNWNPLTGTLTLTGTDSFSNYRTALRSVTYQNTNNSPDTAATRTISFQLSDGILPSNIISRDVTVRATSTSPVLSGVNSTVNYVEQSAPLTIAPNLVVTSLNLTSATVTFTNWQGEDRVEFHNVYALQHTFTQDLIAHTAVLTITGNDTADHYQTLLRSVIYWDVSTNPITSVARTTTFSVTDVNSDSGSGNQSVTVTAYNNPPLVQVNDSSTLTYKSNDPAIIVFGNALVSDPDSNKLTKLTVQITSGYQNNSGGHDLLSFTNQWGITGAFDTNTGTLTLSGTSYVGYYREALRSVAFSTSGSAVSTATRSFTVIATDDFTSTPASSIPVSRDITVTP